VSLFLPYLDSVSVFLCGLISRFGRAWFIGRRVEDHGVYLFWVGLIYGNRLCTMSFINVGRLNRSRTGC
jgi:hypothetical protein